MEGRSGGGVAGCIAVPRACRNAALIAAYAMHKRREMFMQQCMYGGLPSPTQREYCNKYPAVDFGFKSFMAAGLLVLLVGHLT